MFNIVFWPMQPFARCTPSMKSVHGACTGVNGTTYNVIDVFIFEVLFKNFKLTIVKI